MNYKGNLVSGFICKQNVKINNICVHEDFRIATSSFLNRNRVKWFTVIFAGNINLTK